MFGSTRKLKRLQKKQAELTSKIEKYQLEIELRDNLISNKNAEISRLRNKLNSKSGETNNSIEEFASKLIQGIDINKLIGLFNGEAPGDLSTIIPKGKKENFANCIDYIASIYEKQQDYKTANLLKSVADEAIWETVA